MIWLLLPVFHSREASLKNSASTKMERSTLIKTRMKVKNLEMMKRKKDVMVDTEVKANMVTENTTKNITHTVLESSSGWASWPFTSGT